MGQMVPMGFTRVDKRGLLEPDHMETIEQNKRGTPDEIPSEISELVSRTSYVILG